MTGSPERRGDSLPEYSEYRDEGCDLFPLCLSCPLARCRYDDQSGRRPTKRLRDREVLSQRRLSGRSTSELASIYGVSRRTVQRIIRRSYND